MQISAFSSLPNENDIECGREAISFIRSSMCHLLVNEPFFFLRDIKFHLNAPLPVCHAPPPFLIRVWDIPASIFHFRARDLKIRKIASGYSLAVLAIETLPSISPSTNTTIWSGDFGCFHFKLCKNRLCSMLNSSMFTHTRRQSLPVKITKAK